MTDTIEQETVEQEPQAVECITSFTVVMTLDGSISLTDSSIPSARQPSQADLKMIAWFLNDQLNVNPPAPEPKNANDAIKKKLAQRKG